MVPLGTVVAITRSHRAGPGAIVKSLSIGNDHRDARARVRLGEALDLMNRCGANILPIGSASEWTAMSYPGKAGAAGREQMVQSRRPGDPAGVAGPALTGPGADNNLWTQIGLMLLIALAAKNAILIARVTHGRWLRHEMPILDAAVGAARAWFAADPDDVVRAHPGRGAAGAGHDRGGLRGRTFGDC